MFLTTNKVELRSLDINDSAEFYAWSCDREVTQFSLSSYAYPQSKADISSWLSSINSNAKCVSLGVCCAETGKLIGYAGIASISALNRCGEYFILIGDKTYWGKGIGTEVTKLITNYGFNTLGLHRIELTAYTNNPSAIKAYANAGYVHEGVKRQSGFRDGEFVDKVMMAVLAPDWKNELL
ncbi:GNAT family N-acetyltransferase [Moritella sp. Urea-trap-13]|uniref:GNAT family N-acetyltransferase n=1 Tax=Moritella sp. Urea-trap-13 TaxID=2058327 RepID=UPI000C330B5E|nr:GNAT family protein [Moritella sp. Urea-trap-13]PKH07406.1 GNAT family N-acetyltransferase [Moritella sp. Urea-trap-13]